MKKFFGFGSSTPPPPPPPARPPSPPASKAAPPKPAPPAKESPAATPSIVGQWKDPDGSSTTEFRGDGNVVEKPASGDTIRGQYVLEGAQLKVRLEGMAEELSFTIAIKNDSLEMKDSDGQVTNYRRVGT